MVSILGKEYLYKFPRPIPRKYNLKDFLQDNVPEKYYLSQAMIDYLTGINQKQSKYDRSSRFASSLKLTNEDNIAGCITTAAGQRVTDNFVVDKYKEFLEETGKDIPELFNPYNKMELNELAPTQTTQSGSTTSSATVLIRENTIDGFKEAHEGDGINISSRMHYQRGNVQNGMSQTLKTTCEVGVCEFEPNDSEFTETEAKLFTEDGHVRRYIGSDIIDKFEEGDMATTTFPNGYGHGPRTHKDLSITLNTIDNPVVKKNFKIRKLTPIEAMRLMAFQDIDTQHMYEVGCTDSNIFHCAGDSIIVTCLLGIFAKLFGVGQTEIKQLIYDYIETIRKEH